MPDLVDVMLCCRDEHGEFTGVVEAADFGEEDARLSSFFEEGEAPRLSWVEVEHPQRDLVVSGYPVKPAIRVSRNDGADMRTFFYADHIGHVGNVCWDQVRLPLPEARDLLRHLLRLGLDLEAHALRGPFSDITTLRP